MNEKIRFGKIDLFKFIAAFLVITIHTDPLSFYSNTSNFILTRIISRLAVPFFFISAGYLFFIKLTEDKKENYKLLFQYIKRILIIYIASIIIYVPLNIYNGHFKYYSNITNILKDLIFNGTMYHLWYLPGLMIGVLISYLLISKFNINIALLISIALYVIGLLGDSYYGITQNIGWLRYIYYNLFIIIDYTRNGIFFAPIFILLGYKLSRLYNKNKYPGAWHKDLIMFIVFFILFVIETFILREYNIPKHDSMTIFLVPSVFLLFKVCIQLKDKSMKNLREMSLYIYYIL